MTDQIAYGLSYVEHLSYIGLFLAVGFSGYVIPIPEEIILILGGFIAAEGVSNLFAVMIVCIAGAIFGDTLIFYLSGHGSRFTHKYHAMVERSHVGWYLRHMRERPMLTIFFSRFIVGMRFLNPLVSGLMRVRSKNFVIATGLSAAIYIPIVTLLGYIFSNEIFTVLRVVRSIREFILIVLAAGSMVLIILFFRNLVEKWR